MLDRHCADARFAWNLALEQFNWGRSRRPAPGRAERMRQLAEARREFAWLGDGSSSVQQQALRDFDRAVAGFFARTHRCPTWRRKHLHEGFCVRDTKVRVLNRKWAELHVPKLGFVRFSLSRPLPAGKLGMARITRDKGGRWHVAFPSPQTAVPDAGRVGRAVGVDRGVATTLATSNGGMWRAPVMRRRERKRVVRLQQRLARCQTGSRRRGTAKAAIARIHHQVADRRRDWVEKTTTLLAARYEVIGVDALPVCNMVRRPKPKPDPDNEGGFLPNGGSEGWA